jgi:hypothetical protein
LLLRYLGIIGGEQALIVLRRQVVLDYVAELLSIEVWERLEKLLAPFV